MYAVQDMCWEDFALANGLVVKRSPEVQQSLGRRVRGKYGNISIIYCIYIYICIIIYIHMSMIFIHLLPIYILSMLFI